MSVTRQVSKAKKVFLVGCGCFNPPTIMHQRMFEIGRDHLHSLKTQPHAVLGGVLSPTHDKYPKPDLLPSVHRNAMVRLALQNCQLIRLSTWETEQEDWTRTRVVLDTYRRQIEDFATGKTEVRPEWIPKEVAREELQQGVGLYLLCGDDLLESFNVPGLWSPEDIKAIVSDHGLVVLSRAGGMKALETVYKTDVLHEHKDNIHIALSDMGTDISSTKCRLAIRRNRSVKYVVADGVIRYIEENRLYSKFEYKSGNCNRHRHVTVVLPPKTITLAQEQDRSCNNDLDDDHDSNNSFSPTSPYYLPMHRHSVTPPNSPAVARKRSAKGSQCDLDNNSSSSLSKIPMIDNDEDALQLLVGLMSIENEVDAMLINNCRERRRKRTTTTSDKRSHHQGGRAKSEPALQIELTSTGVKITSERESYL